MRFWGTRGEKRKQERQDLGTFLKPLKKIQSVLWGMIPGLVTDRSVWYENNVCIIIFEKHLFQERLTEAYVYKMPLNKGKKTSEAEVNIQKSHSVASLPQSSLYNRNETVYENVSTDEMLRQPHQSLKRSEYTALR